jgi:hypothetical protein
MKTKKHILVICVAALTAGSFQQQVAMSADPITLDQIRDAWRQRQDRIRTLSYTWSVEHYIPAGGLTADEADKEYLRELMATSSGKPFVKSSLAEIPPVPYEATTASRLLVDGSKVLVEVVRPLWSKSRGEVIQLPRRSSVVDGKVTRLYAKGSTATDYPDAMITKGDSNSDIKDPEIYAIALTLFGNDKSKSPLPIEHSTIFPDGQRPGQSIVELRSSRAAGRTYQLRVDATHGYLPIRFATISGSRLETEVSITYQGSDESCWVPKSWVVKRFNVDGSLMQSAVCTATEIRLNEPIEASRFLIDLPSGTVFSRSDKSDGSEEYGLVRSDGSIRRLSNQEIAMRYEDLDEQRSPKWSSRRWVFLGIAVGTALFIIGVIVARRRRLRRAPDLA